MRRRVGVASPYCRWSLVVRVVMKLSVYLIAKLFSGEQGPFCFSRVRRARGGHRPAGASRRAVVRRALRFACPSHFQRGTPPAPSPPSPHPRSPSQNNKRIHFEDTCVP